MKEAALGRREWVPQREEQKPSTKTSEEVRRIEMEEGEGREREAREVREEEERERPRG